MPTLKIRQKDYDRLKKTSQRTRVPMAQLVADFLKDSGGTKRMEKIEDKEGFVCDECDAELPEDTNFCPNCGIEFEEEEEEEEEEED